MANEFLVNRSAKATFTLTNTGTTINSGVYIPAGAVITGVRVCAPNALTITGASASVVLRVGTVAIIASSNVSTVAAVSTPRIIALATTGGIFVPAGGQLNLVESASSNSAATVSYNFYVDYLV